MGWKTRERYVQWTDVDTVYHFRSSKYWLLKWLLNISPSKLRKIPLNVRGHISVLLRVYIWSFSCFLNFLGTKIRMYDIMVCIHCIEENHFKNIGFLIAKYDYICRDPIFTLDNHYCRRTGVKAKFSIEAVGVVDIKFAMKILCVKFDQIDINPWL